MIKGLDESIRQVAEKALHKKCGIADGLSELNDRLSLFHQLCPRAKEILMKDVREMVNMSNGVDKTNAKMAFEFTKEARQYPYSR